MPLMFPRFFGNYGLPARPVLSVLCTVLLVLFALCAFAPANAQEVRIGYVDMNRIMRTSPAAEALMRDLSAEFEPRIQALDAEESALSREASASPPSPEVHSQFAERNSALQQRRRALQREYEQRQSRQLQRLADRVARAVHSVATQGDFGAVLDQAVYVSPSRDLTDQVLERLERPDS